MKRYVKEFASDLLREKHCESVKEEIQKAVQRYERGLITSKEAIKAILKSVEMEAEMYV